MKNLRGIIVAAVLGLLTLILQQVAQRFDVLMSMVYPFASKTYVELVGAWTNQFDYCLWQVLIGIFVVAVVASLCLAVLFRWNLLRWLGAVLVPVTLVGLLQTGLWGLNYYTKPLNESMKLSVGEYTVSDLKEAAQYYRQKTEELAVKVPRDKEGDLMLPNLEWLNKIAGQSYDNLVWDYSVFAGSRGPVKALGWSDTFSAFGVDGVTIGLTGEAAINLNQYEGTLPFNICHEIAHLLAFAREGEANFAAYLACEYSDDPAFRYSGYLNAFLFCSNALYDASKSAWKELWTDIPDQIRHDVEAINDYINQNDGETKDQAQAAYDLALKLMGESSGVAGYGEVTDLLVAWYIDQYRPADPETDNAFDPTDYNWVFPAPTEETEPTEGG